jgi:hypothetical protein
MILVMRGAEVTGGPESPSRFHYHVPGYGLSGLSRQPLSDACRQLIECGVEPLTTVGRFREGRAHPDLVSTAGAAAALTVSDPDRGTVRLERFKTFAGRRAKVRGGVA